MSSYNDGVTELVSTSVGLEKELQILIEKNMLEFFGVTFLKSEYAITNGRIDSHQTFLQKYALTSKSFQNLFETIKDYILSLDDDITVNQLKYYVAFKR